MQNTLSVTPLSLFRSSSSSTTKNASLYRSSIHLYTVPNYWIRILGTFQTSNSTIALNFWGKCITEAETLDPSCLPVFTSEEVVTALGSEVDRLENEIQEIVPGIRHVDIEARSPIVPPL